MNLYQLFSRNQDAGYEGNRCLSMFFVTKCVLRVKNSFQIQSVAKTQDKLFMSNVNFFSFFISGLLQKDQPKK